MPQAHASPLFVFFFSWFPKRHRLQLARQPSVWGRWSAEMLIKGKEDLSSERMLTAEDSRGTKGLVRGCLVMAAGLTADAFALRRKGEGVGGRGC